MIVKTIDHITINVKDLAKSFDFYESVLGLQSWSLRWIWDLALSTI